MGPLVPFFAIARRTISRRLALPPAPWTGLIAGTAVLLAACSGSVGSSGSDASQVADDIGSVGPMFDGENQAPDFELVLYGNENHSPGERLRLSDLKGKPVVVNFWFPSCPPCRAEMPDLEASFREHRADGVEFIGVQLVGLDSAEDGQKFVDEIGVTYALGADEGASITRDFQVTSFPTTVFLDREHRIVREWGGILTADKLEELVQEALAPADAEMT